MVGCKEVIDMWVSSLVNSSKGCSAQRITDPVCSRDVENMIRWSFMAQNTIPASVYVRDYLRLVLTYIIRHEVGRKALGSIA